MEDNLSNTAAIIEKFKEHLVVLRQEYKEATFHQRLSVAKERINYPDCYANQICNHISAIEGISRSIVLMCFFREGVSVNEAYDKVSRKNASILIKLICRKVGISPRDMFGENWVIFSYAEQYRNLLIHESAFIRQDYGKILVEACAYIIRELENNEHLKSFRSS